MTRDLGTDDTATAASAIDVGVDTGADPNPATTGLLTDAHISSFLRHVRRRADDEVAGLVLGAAPLGTGTGVTVDPTPGVAVPVVAAGPTTDMDAGAADGLLPGVADFDPALAGSDGDEVTAAAPDGADFDPTSLDLVWAHGGGATAAIPTGTGGVVGGVSDGGLGTGASADDDFLAGVVDFDAPSLAWRDSDEVATAAPSAVDGATIAATGATPTVAATVAARDVVDFEPTGVRKRKRKKSHTVQDARKYQRRRLPAIHGSAPGTDSAGNDMRFLPEQPEQSEKFGDNSAENSRV